MKEKETEATAKTYAHTYDGGVTEDQINQWKRKHRKVIRIEVPDGDDLHVGYFHRPSIDTMAAVSKQTKDSEIRGAETLFKNCWLGGSEDMATDSVLFFSAVEQLNIAFEGSKGTLKNL